ncbi:MAG TPA: MFS transporter [Steroidobacteraceae bacterium]|nr:MFS transporter [Steroidobacteraceae bacterium]
MTPAQRLRNILGGSAGNFVEWFDWFAYSAFAIYFSRVFFPEGDQTAQLLHAAAIFAVGFIARPVGAWLFGAYADRAGRRAALTLSVALMCGGSLMIAVIPTGHGVVSAGLLLLARVLQGLSVGGEYGASATYISEMSVRHQRGFWSGFLYVTLTGGQLAALLLQVLLQGVLTEQQLYDWGWRVPFAVGAALSIVVWWIRRGIHETRSFTHAAGPAHERGRVWTLFARYPRETLTVMALTAAGGLGFYTYTAYMQKLLVNSAGFAKPVASQVMTLLLAVFLILPPLAGWVADRVGHRRTLLASFGGLALVSVPVLGALASATNPVTAFMLALLPLVLLSGYCGLSAICKAELYPAHVRALGVAVPYALAQAIFGGNAETAALSLKQAGHESAYFWLVAAMMVVGVLASLRLRETREHSLIHLEMGSGPG